MVGYYKPETPHAVEERFAGVQDSEYYHLVHVGSDEDPGEPLRLEQIVEAIKDAYARGFVESGSEWTLRPAAGGPVRYRLRLDGGDVACTDLRQAT